MTKICHREGAPFLKMVADDARLVNSLIVVKLPFSPSLKVGPYVINDLETPNEYKSVAKWKRNLLPA